MAVAKVTVTAKTGPAKSVSSQIFTGVTALTLDFKRQLIQVYAGELTGPAAEFDMADTITVTDTVAGAGLGHTIVVSSS